MKFLNKSNIITLFVILFLSGCSTGPSKTVADACTSDPKWYKNEDCPKGYLCGYGKSGSGRSQTAELGSKSRARNDLTATISQWTKSEFVDVFQELQGSSESAQAFENAMTTDKFVTLIEGEVTSAMVFEKQDDVCKGKNWYWTAVKKDIDGIDFNKLFNDVSKSPEVSEKDQKFIEESIDWAIEAIKNK